MRTTVAQQATGCLRFHRGSGWNECCATSWTKANSWRRTAFGRCRAFIATAPSCCVADGQEHRVDYTPGESTSGLFGGNSNWRGPIWFPVNYLVIEALERYHHFYGDEVRVECPTGSGQQVNLFEASQELRRRLATLFLPDAIRPSRLPRR